MEPTYFSGLMQSKSSEVHYCKQVRYTYQNYGNSAGVKVSSEVN